MSERVIFRRVNGRIIPIRRDTDKEAVAKLAGSVGISVAGAAVSSNFLKKSNQAFKKSAFQRGARRLGKVGTSTSKRITEQVVKSNKLARRGLFKSKSVLFASAIASSVLAGSASGEALGGRVNEETKDAFSTGVSVIAGLGTVALFGKRAKLRGFGKSIRESLKSGSFDEQVGVLFGKFRTEGQQKSIKAIKKIARTRRRKKGQLDFGF